MNIKLVPCKALVIGALAFLTTNNISTAEDIPVTPQNLEMLYSTADINKSELKSLGKIKRSDTSYVRVYNEFANNSLLYTELAENYLQSLPPLSYKKTKLRRQIKKKIIKLAVARDMCQPIEINIGTRRLTDL